MGSALCVYDANWPPKAKWSVDGTPDLSDKTILVTGGNGGIGKETVKALLLRNAKVYIASHNEARVDAAIDELERMTQKEGVAYRAGPR
ncbi:NAD(P)-binding protein [Mycena sanguinolenta]|uniref:NAD(P)-binding protein n=1 Tax=Mycena sanguinolenta TaxID=230812 RepID=A0A8H6Y7F5_9AGAR|nr:NAD(P)-binding protein [Mycena sanguinolenta]